MEKAEIKKILESFLYHEKPYNPEAFEFLKENKDLFQIMSSFDEGVVTGFFLALNVLSKKQEIIVVPGSSTPSFKQFKVDPIIKSLI